MSRRTMFDQTRSWLFCLATVLCGAAHAHAAAQAAEVAGPEAARRAQQVASFNGGQITLGDIEDAIAIRLPQERERIALPGGRERVLADLIRYDLLVAEATRRGYATHVPVQDAARGEAILSMTAKQFASDPAAIAAADIARALDQRKTEFARPLMRRAATIRVATHEAAVALEHELRGADRDRFARVAGERSEDPRTKRQGGELGYFDRDGRTDTGQASGVPAPLVAATFALPHLAAVSPPIAFDGGFSLVMLTGEMSAQITPRAQAEATVRAQLAEDARTRSLDELVNTLRAQQKPEVHAELIDSIVLDNEETPRDLPQGFPAAPTDPREPPHIAIPD